MYGYPCLPSASLSIEPTLDGFPYAEDERELSFFFSISESVLSSEATVFSTLAVVLVYEAICIIFY